MSQTTISETALVWDRTCKAILAQTNWQCCNEARLGGKGPVVATVCRVGNAGCQRVIVRLAGRLVGEFPFLDHESMLQGERIAEAALGGVEVGR